MTALIYLRIVINLKGENAFLNISSISIQSLWTLIKDQVPQATIVTGNKARLIILKVVDATILVVVVITIFPPTPIPAVNPILPTPAAAPPIFLLVLLTFSSIWLSISFSICCLLNWLSVLSSSSESWLRKGILELVVFKLLSITWLAWS